MPFEAAYKKLPQRVMAENSLWVRDVIILPSGDRRVIEPDFSKTMRIFGVTSRSIIFEWKCRRFSMVKGCFHIFMQVGSQVTTPISEQRTFRQVAFSSLELTKRRSGARHSQRDRRYVLFSSLSTLPAQR